MYWIEIIRNIENGGENINFEMEILLCCLWLAKKMFIIIERQLLFHVYYTGIAL